MKKSTKQLAQDCISQGGSPLLSMSGSYIGCQLGTKTVSSSNHGEYNAVGTKTHLVSNASGVDGYYNGDGGSEQLDGYYNAGGKKIDSLLDSIFPKRNTIADTKTSESDLNRSEADMNRAISQALGQSGGATTKTQDTGMPVIAKVGIGALVVGVIGFIVYKIIKRKK